MSELKLFTPSDLAEFLSTRPGETRLGERILCLQDLDTPWNLANKIVLLGVPEDIGPRANLGIGGSDGAWRAFLKKFVNMQSNKFLSGENICIAGEIQVGDLMDAAHDLSVKNEDELLLLRTLVAQLDDRVSTTIKQIKEAGGFPVVIGGGHNNAYGCIKGASQAIGKAINAINLDPHADYRQLEGRHSGNGFSYARNEGYLDKYHVVCLHESYNNTFMLKKSDDGAFTYSTYEGFLNTGLSFKQFIEVELQDKNGSWGVELDLDSIAFTPTSAETPSGLSVEQARLFVLESIRNLNIEYVHLAEGAPDLHAEGELIIGKLLAYLVCDICKSLEKPHN